MKTTIKIPCTYYRVNHTAWLTNKHRCMIEGKTCQVAFNTLHECSIIKHKWNAFDRMLYMAGKLKVKVIPIMA